MKAAYGVVHTETCTILSKAVQQHAYCLLCKGLRPVACLVVQHVDVGRWVADEPLTQPTRLCIWRGCTSYGRYDAKKAMRHMDGNVMLVCCCWLLLWLLLWLLAAKIHCSPWTPKMGC